MTPFSLNHSTSFSSSSNYLQTPTSYSSSFHHPTTTIPTSRSYAPYSSVASINSGTKSSLFPFEDGGPVSLPFSHIPPIKETHQSNNNALNNLNIHSTNTSTHTSNIPTTSFQLNKNNSQTLLNLQLMTSPTRNFR